MPKTELTEEEKERRASRVVHALPLYWLAYGALVAAAYVLVGDTPLFLVAAYIATALISKSFATGHRVRHTVMRECVKCRANTKRGKGNAIRNRFLRWYFHRRIVDSKAAMLILHVCIVVTIIYEALGKPHAELIFLIGLEIFIVQLAFLARSANIHRAYESGCKLCASGDDPFPYDRVSESQLQD